jgi:hypothetical protein
MTHYFASRNYIRNSSVVDAILNKFPELKNKPLHKVGCIIDPKIDLIPNDKDDHFLVSLGGSIAPVISIEQNIYYAKQVLHFINNIAQRPYFNTYPWIVVCHPLIHKALKKEAIALHKNISIVSSVGMNRFMKMIRSAKAVFVPPGYGTVQEACYSNKPLFLLPEQNAGQPLYLKSLQDHQFPYQYSLTLTQDLNNGKLIYKEFDIDRMYGDMHSLIYESKYKNIRDVKIDAYRTLLKNKQLLHEYTKLQFESMQRMPGGFEGAAVIAQGISEEALSFTK